ncbi:MULTISPECIES: IucA/IucC family C-terminal-domain containing protein [Bacillaceae]|uniref:IucA/IucC family C-terminal-domain containing protein n=1 Tax=Bacillaceae TaxID=186817 RepID=UPI0016049DF6|nr:IucA/IucC family C-terminal-domain containing protein [Bacillus sp. PK3_68]
MNSFTNEELAVLEEKYRLTTRTASSSLTIQANGLLDDQQLCSYLLQVKDKIKAANTTVAASLFIKRYSFAILIALYSMSVLNKRLDFSFRNIWIETLDEEEPLWLPSFRFSHLAADEPGNVDRVKWREEAIQQIFGGHIDLLFTHVKRQSRLSKLIMWENLYTYIRWMYESLLNTPEYHGQHETLANDFHYLVKEGAGSLFGSYHQNPLLRCESSQQRVEKNGTVIQKRKTCCLSYLAGSKGKRCSVCPIDCTSK